MNNKSKKAKMELIFDESDRRMFLKGFQQRKQERRQRANKEMEEQLKTEMKLMKKKRKEKLENIMEEMRQATLSGSFEQQETESNVKFDVEEQTVQIKATDICNVQRSLKLTKPDKHKTKKQFGRKYSRAANREKMTFTTRKGLNLATKKKINK